MAWLAWQIENTQVSATCWLYAGMQSLANGLALVANALIGGVNVIARALILVVLDIQGLALWAWYGFELTRMQWWAAEDFFAGVLAFFTWIGQAIGAVFVFIGNFIGMLGALVASLLGLAGWVIGLLGQLIGSVLKATTWSPQPTVAGMLTIQASAPPMPTPLQGTSTIYCALRGMLDGMLASKLAWTMYLLYALAYVGFVYWASRFFANGERSA